MKERVEWPGSAEMVMNQLAFETNNFFLSLISSSWNGHSDDDDDHAHVSSGNEEEDVRLKVKSRYRLPVVIGRAPTLMKTEKWNNISYFESRFGSVVQEVKRQPVSHPTFSYWNSEKKLAGKFGVPSVPFFEVLETMKTSDFLAIVTDKYKNNNENNNDSGSVSFHFKDPKLTVADAENYVYYYSADLYGLPEKIQKDLKGLEVTYANIDAENKQANLWIGEAGVAAGTHYDTSHNFFLQLQGEKEFILLPPSSVRDLGVYPFHHPAYRRGQSSSLENYNKSRPISVILKPGEVLYLPPFWFHNVIAKTFSVSVNSWFDSEEYHNAESLFNLPLPFEANWSSEMKKSMVYRYLKLIATVDELKYLLESRFERIGITPDLATKFTVNRDYSCVSLQSSSSRPLPVDLEMKLQKGSKKAKVVLDLLPNNGVREIYLYLYIEVLADFFLGEDLPYFLSCYY